MSLSNVATFAVLPPGNLIALALAGTVLSVRWPRFGRWIAALSLLALVVLAMPVTADWLTVRLEDGLALQPDPANPPGAIVVLGGDVARRARGGSDIGPLSLERVRTAAALARRTGLPILVTGGVTNDDTADVCAVMADSLREDFHQPARWTECRSLDTWENAAMSAPLLKADGIHAAYLVTHAWHMRRGMLAFGPTGLAVTPAPVGLDAEPTWRDSGLVPSASGLHRSYYAIHEWVGLLYYRLRLLMQ